MLENAAPVDHSQLKVRVQILEKILRMHQVTLATALWIASWTAPFMREDVSKRFDDYRVFHSLTDLLGIAWSGDRWSPTDETFWALRVSTGLLAAGLVGLAVVYIHRWLTSSDTAKWPLWVVSYAVMVGAAFTLFAIEIANVPVEPWSPTLWIALPAAMGVLVLYSEKTHDTW